MSALEDIERALSLGRCVSTDPACPNIIAGHNLTVTEDYNHA